MNFKPLWDRVIITPVEKPKEKNGIILSGVDNNPWYFGKIEAIGTDIEHVKVGDTVAFYKVDATPMEIEEVVYICLRETQIKGIINA